MQLISQIAASEPAGGAAIDQVVIATLAAGASATVCIQATLPTSAANSVQGTNPIVTLTVDGVQVP